MIQALLPWLADAIAGLGLVVLSVAVYGIVRMPDVYTRLHAAGKAGLMGALPILVAATLGSETSAVPKAILIGAFLVLTTPIVAHEIGRAAYLEGRRMVTPGSVDESGTELEHGADPPAEHAKTAPARSPGRE
jgi:multicomponent Na+:H+ antiporter subunit G